MPPQFPYQSASAVASGTTGPAGPASTMALAAISSASPAYTPTDAQLLGQYPQLYAPGQAPSNSNEAVTELLSALPEPVKAALRDENLARKLTPMGDGRFGIPETDASLQVMGGVDEAGRLPADLYFLIENADGSQVPFTFMPPSGAGAARKEESKKEESARPPRLPSADRESEPMVDNGECKGNIWKCTLKNLADTIPKIPGFLIEAFCYPLMDWVFKHLRWGGGVEDAPAQMAYWAVDSLRGSLN